MSSDFPLSRPSTFTLGENLKLSLRARGLRRVSVYLAHSHYLAHVWHQDQQPAWTAQGYGCSLSIRLCRSLPRSFHVNTEVTTKCD